MNNIIDRRSFMQDIVIVGATGFIGRHLVAIISSQKEVRLRVLVRKYIKDKLFNKTNITLIKGDLLCPDTLKELCVENATVINLAYLRDQPQKQNLAAVNNLIDVCLRAKISRFIHCSTAAVFGRISDDIITEQIHCSPASDYEIIKMKIEETVLDRMDRECQSIILRPTAIFGPGGKNLIKLAIDLKTGRRIANYLKACLYNKRKMNLVSVHNVVGAIIFLMQNHERNNRGIFIVSDDEFKNNNYSYVEDNLRKKLGLSGYSLPVIPIPDYLLKLVLMITGKSNVNPRCVYSCRKLLDSGFNRAIVFEQALSDFADWYKNCPKGQRSFE